MDAQTMTKAILAEEAMPDQLSSPLQALWYAKAGEWDLAHQIAQEAGSLEGDWVHAYLHRVEGDLSNASYWYRRAGRKMPEATLEEEWAELVDTLS